MKRTFLLFFTILFAFPLHAEPITHHIDSVERREFKEMRAVRYTINWKVEPLSVYLFLVSDSNTQAEKIVDSDIMLRADLALHPVIDEIEQHKALQSVKSITYSQWTSTFLISPDLRGKTFIFYLVKGELGSPDVLIKKSLHSLEKELADKSVEPAPIGDTNPITTRD